MKCGDLIEKLEESFPLSYAAGWDNPGLMAGRREKEVISEDELKDCLQQ